MKLRTRILVAVAVIATLTGIGAIAEQHVSALGPVSITVTAPSTVQAGQPITFTAVASDGSTPTNQRITWTNPRTRKTNNVANYTVIPVVYDAATGNYLFTYVPDVSELNRTETFSVVTSCTRLGCLVSGYASFTVLAAPVVATP